MSIKARPWEGGGAATVPDATETTKGKIRIATSAEATTGTDDTIAMTPLTVKERIDASLVGGVEYKGTFNATAGTPSLANAEKGDMYVVDTAGTIYGQTWAVGDHLLINENMGGSITNSKIDKVDNTDAVTSVNGSTGAVVLSGDDLAADHTASNYTAANANIDGHLSGIDTALGSVGGNQITDVEIKTTSSFTAASNYIYLCSYTGGTQTITFPAASSSNDGDLIAVFSNSTVRAVSIVSSDGTTNDIIDINNTQKGGTSGALSLNIDRQLVWFSPSGTAWRQLNAAPATVATTGAYSDLSGTPTLATVATTGAYSDLSGTPTLATVATSGAYSDLSGTPTLATVATSGAYSDLSGTPTLGTAAAADTGDFLASSAGLDDLSDVSYTAGAGIDNYVLTYDHSTTSWGAEVVPSAPVTSVNSLTGAVTISGDDVAADHTASNYTAANANVDGHFSGVDTALGNKQPLDAGLTSISGLTTAANKMLYTTASDTYAVADLTSAGRALLDDADASAQRTTLGLGTASTSASTDFLASTAGLNDLSDVSFTAGAGIDNYVLTYDHSTTSWGAEAAASGGLSAVVDDTSPQLGGDMDLNNYDLVTTSNADLDLAPHGTGVVVVRGNTNSGALKLNCEANTHGVTIQGPPHSAAATYTLTLPNNDGDADQVLKTDGSGGLSWVDQASGGGGWTYSAITADPANAQAGYHYSCTGTFTITLPTSGVSAGEEIRVKNMGTGTITIDPQTQNIDGSTTDYTMDIQYSAITLVSTGAHWEII